ncbi:glycosyltransferase family 4 protein [Bradyrhizobium diazoefficiens]|uniref:Blr6297 protein n=1 Tax=Bradyrhizobium diazoefficiens (strain JCM 10833 / BCRC 13528 / IAM 13628 / NBRC 14792 / USDA 110) TaxID=224911 RepID=Q89GP8_BRADU|nr:glycosyltransferase family 4 protein [Bradyrhizobium diazoefficiens]QBP25052.1 glycosyltransferase WbuB [Bradyrhizobium diazoefficiens]QLD41985.1 glycosyltransferase family 4 protein [Bradyrhizobium diazoefficiens]WLB36462.1 glycosyltransferase family 4 protein [Bradyrhizobium diazoefficiens]WLC18537.1 glycosyltransferase family 4 protein [Bradyrhizobium diazoefficiens]BAC51562.1 blr6297 [Bradyrhizobium diazoefficiens USDA 110]
MSTRFRNDRSASHPAQAGPAKPPGSASIESEFRELIGLDANSSRFTDSVTGVPPLTSGAVRRRVLIIVENLPVPFDRRVWSEATTLARHGYDVSIICPKGPQATASFEVIEGIAVYRHWLPREGRGAVGYLAEYSAALFWEFGLSLKILATRGFDVIHACNPPDLIFLVGGVHKFLFGKSFIFDHHDINPELYEAKFERRGILWRAMVLFERLTFALADVSIATNQSYRTIAVERGRMNPDRVFVVRSGPNLSRVQSLPSDPTWKRGRTFLVAYVGVIGKQEGLDLLLESIKHIRGSRNRDDIQFVIVGSGPELDNVKKLATALELDESITFTGRVDDVTLFTVLSTADVCVNPDRPNAMNDKSTMNKIMEYMALGKPIVQFDLTEGRVSAGEASLYARNTDTAEFGDMILELLDDPVRRARMGAFGKKRIDGELAWDHEANKLLSVYDTVFDLRGSHEAARRHT